ncbi:Gfo/Idh/MocA family oxidoreductase [Rhizobium jaguaris]|uniref:Myo-inositol 2-dehydrogenase n=1 Tax=Rhizobium jaguaris TaxID=1312183 RepID=A0A387FRX7_9HYPH|nr:Gfo/Idh/MocA family oxidoreductase [Rhizobium jaguaris]AYG57546.1 myo-inositol 2-dehydrogenase [Rhizobium jaguaris]
MSIRIAVIGAGIMGADHARIIADDLPGAKLQLVCDASRERAKAVADLYDVKEVLTDPEAVFMRGDVDAVVIASPDTTHAPLSLAAIRTQKPVLCEKPLSQSSAQCLEVIDAEIESGRQFLQLGFMRRFDQSYLEMKESLSDGSIGRALMMHNFHRNVETPASDFTAAMAITNSAPHEFDVTRFVLGTEYAAITAFQARRTDGVVAPVMMVLETIESQLVSIEVNNNAAYGYDVRAELIGEIGSVSLAAPIHSRRNTSLSQVTRYDADWRLRYYEAYRRQNKAFLKFVNTGVFPAGASNAWDGYCAAVIGEAGAKSLREGKRVEIKLAEMPEFYGKKKELAA